MIELKLLQNQWDFVDIVFEDMICKHSISQRHTSQQNISSKDHWAFEMNGMAWRLANGGEEKQK